MKEQSDETTSGRLMIWLLESERVRGSSSEYEITCG